MVMNISSPELRENVMNVVHKMDLILPLLISLSLRFLKRCLIVMKTSIIGILTAHFGGFMHALTRN